MATFFVSFTIIVHYVLLHDVSNKISRNQHKLGLL